ncbi:uncharacterized protein LOC128743126 isoform X1 [Sabethes cyaneus]|uniref:uncharacterized protein LOC128743126 isoform X1 n=1 Tax=Sabethes cyaneus TaxID=53552 RepID=UPI00221E28BE|nr:uncharacterized protein LOC128743126 isoform X1 [Sabethes cyaneus]
MGLPDLPEQADEDQTFSIGEGNVINMDFTSDDSEYESGEDNEFIGYQPLSLHDSNETTINEHEVGTGETRVTANISNVYQSNPDFLNLDVWNAPRPTELNIELDGAKANQIVNVMAGFELPNSSVPAWAVGIPEDKWKQELLQRIRQRQHSEDIQKSNN